MATSDQFLLRWNEFQNKLSSGFNNLLEEKVLLDVTLCAGGEFIQAHKLVLSVCSNYFKKLFTLNPCKHPIVILTDIEIKQLQAILEFMYKGEVNISQDDLPAFLKTGELLQISGLTDNPGGSHTPTRSSIPHVSSPPKINDGQKKMAQNILLENSSDIRPTEELIPPPLKRFRSDPISSEKLIPNTKENIPHEAFLPVVNIKQESELKQDDFDDEDSSSRLQQSDNMQIPKESTEAYNANETFEEPFSDLNDDPSSPSSMHEPSSSVDGSQGNIQFVLSRRGQRQLVHNGYIYSCTSNYRSDKALVGWRCTQYQKYCKARCYTSKGLLYLTNSAHNHPQQLEEIKLKEKFTQLNLAMFSNSNQYV